MKPIYIVGGGMFGCVLKDFLAIAGVESTIIDMGKKHSGTSASGNITKPSWVTGLGDDAKRAYEDLDQVYGLDKFSPEVALGKTIDLYYVPRWRFLQRTDIPAMAVEVGDGYVKTEIMGEGKSQLLEGTIVVCAGVWCDELVEMPPIDRMMGISAIYYEPKGFKPQFKVWAPYKQAISYAEGNHVWYGDGTAIKQANWDTAKRTHEFLVRAEKYGLTNPMGMSMGLRPYVKGHKNGYLAQVHKNTWVNTGGGKNGIVLAAVQARKFMEWLSEHH